MTSAYNYKRHSATRRSSKRSSFERFARKAIAGMGRARFKIYKRDKRVAVASTAHAAWIAAEGLARRSPGWTVKVVTNGKTVLSITKAGRGGSIWVVASGPMRKFAPPRRRASKKKSSKRRTSRR